MLKIINNLKPFFEDCYRFINVREYSRLRKISPPTASKILKEYCKLGFLEQEKDRNYHFFKANISSRDFIDLSRIYWRKKLESLQTELQKKLMSPSAALFGSLSKAEAKLNSDMDIAIFSVERKEINLKPYEEKLNRKISLYLFKSIESGDNPFLINNIINGYVLFGNLRLK